MNNRGQSGGAEGGGSEDVVDVEERSDSCVADLAAGFSNRGLEEKTQTHMSNPIK